MDVLVARCGTDTTVDHLRRRLVCHVCGERPGRVTVAPEDSPGVSVAAKDAWYSPATMSRPGVTRLGAAYY